MYTVKPGKKGRETEAEKLQKFFTIADRASSYKELLPRVITLDLFG